MKKAGILLTVFLLHTIVMYGQIRQIKVNDAVLHYTDKGAGEPVIFVHGSLGDYRTWNTIADKFADRFRVISYSRRLNYPNQNSSEGIILSQESEADDLAGLIRALDLKSAHIVGHSFGGGVALALAKKYPDLVRSLVLSEPASLHIIKDSPEGQREYERFFNELWRPVQIAYDLRDTADVLRHTFNYFFNEDISASLSPEARQSILVNFPEWKATMTSREAFNGYTREDVQQIKVPVLLISADNTMPVMKLTNAEFKTLLPRAVSYHVKDASHDFWMTHQDAVVNEVVSFLHKCSSK